ncbi:MAG: MBL fold metallo-hydrolase [Verrucomicrobiota bacterium]
MIPNPDGDLHVYMVNVGQGDTTVIISPDGGVIVIDAKNPAKLIQLLNDLGLAAGETIEHFVVTHPHSDHFSGGNRLAQEFAIAEATVAPFWFDFAMGPMTYRRLIARFDENDTKTTFLAGYSRFYPDGAMLPGGAGNDPPFDPDAPFLEMLGPTNGMIRMLDDADVFETNHLSIISRLSWGRFRIIISGDAQLENWAFFDDERMLEGTCQVLRSAHHGSKNGTQWERIDRLSPSVVVVSSDPSSGHHLPDLSGAAIFADFDSRDGQMAVLTQDAGTIHLRVNAAGRRSFEHFVDGKDADVDLTNGDALTQQNNPTDWPALLQDRVDNL